METEVDFSEPGLFDTRITTKKAVFYASAFCLTESSETFASVLKGFFAESKISADFRELSIPEKPEIVLKYLRFSHTTSDKVLMCEDLSVVFQMYRFADKYSCQKLLNTTKMVLHWNMNDLCIFNCQDSKLPIYFKCCKIMNKVEDLRTQYASIMINTFADILSRENNPDIMKYIIANPWLISNYKTSEGTTKCAMWILFYSIFAYTPVLEFEMANVCLKNIMKNINFGNSQHVIALKLFPVQYKMLTKLALLRCGYHVGAKKIVRNVVQGCAIEFLDVPIVGKILNFYKCEN
jgi:hypothetical protein